MDSPSKCEFIFVKNKSYWVGKYKSGCCREVAVMKRLNILRG